MKYLNLAVIAVLILAMISCGEKAKTSSHVEEVESMEIDETNDTNDNDIDYVIDEDETEYLEAAMKALDAGDNEKAVVKILQAAEEIKGDLDEMDDPIHAKNAIESLLEFAAKIKSGTKMSGEELEKTMLKLEFFSDDDLEFDDEEIDDSSSDLEE